MGLETSILRDQSQVGRRHGMARCRMSADGRASRLTSLTAAAAVKRSVNGEAACPHDGSESLNVGLQSPRIADLAAQVHAIIAIPLAIKSLQSTILAKDPVFGYDAFVGNALAFSAG
jgi:hypothetical protein